MAVLIVAYNGMRYLDDCLRSLFSADTTQCDMRCVVVDNGSTDGTAQWVRENYPACRVVEPRQNLGFAEGNNRAWREADSEFPKLDFAYLLNQDTLVDPDFLNQAVEYLKTRPNVGAAQSLLLLHPETDLINTAGNSLHFLGFGLPTFFRHSAEDAPDSSVIGYPSGAAVLVRADIVRKHGLFSPELFMYLEDAELGIKLHLIGQPPHLCRASIVYHKYGFASTLGSYQYLERNRWWLLAVHYRVATLFLLIPMLAMMEVGQWVYAAQNGLMRAKIRAYASFVRPRFLSQLRRARKRVQNSRRIGDRDLLKVFSATIDSPYLTSRLLNSVANPIMNWYLRFARWIVRW